MAEQGKIIITITVGEENRYQSAHELQNVEPIAAAWILIDIGREILVRALQEHAQHHHKEEEVKANGR